MCAKHIVFCFLTYIMHILSYERNWHLSCCIGDHTLSGKDSDLVITSTLLHTSCCIGGHSLPGKDLDLVIASTFLHIPICIVGHSLPGKVLDLFITSKILHIPCCIVGSVESIKVQQDMGTPLKIIIWVMNKRIYVCLHQAEALCLWGKYIAMLKITMKENNTTNSKTIERKK